LRFRVQGLGFRVQGLVITGAGGDAGLATATADASCR